jgi:hypothetical protein
VIRQPIQVEAPPHKRGQSQNTNYRNNSDRLVSGEG